MYRMRVQLSERHMSVDIQLLWVVAGHLRGAAGPVGVRDPGPQPAGEPDRVTGLYQHGPTGALCTDR